VANETKTLHERAQVKAGNKTFSFLKTSGGSVISYTLDSFKQLGFSAKGMREGDKVFLKCFGYDNNGMKYRFTIVHIKTKQEFPVWASNGLKEEIAELESYKESKNGNPYFKVPEENVAFYEVVDQETGEVAIVIGKRGEGDDAEIL
jgi:hypothetical protein